MIEFVERRKVDSIMTAASYFVIGLHALLIVLDRTFITSFLMNLPAGEFLTWGWSGATILFVTVTLTGLWRKNLLIEAAGVSALGIMVFSFGVIDIALWRLYQLPVLSAGLLAIALSMVLFHYHIKLRRQLESNKKLGQLAQGSDTLMGAVQEDFSERD